MTRDALDQPLSAELVDGEVVVTGPNGFNGSLTVEAARISAENLMRAVQLFDSGEVYQKPLD